MFEGFLLEERLRKCLQLTVLGSDARLYLRFGVHLYQIPRKLSGRKLEQRLNDLLEDEEDIAREKLLIVYYGGHATQSLYSSGSPIWKA